MTILQDREQKGIQQGIEQGVKMTAKTMIVEGESIDKIMRYTRLSKEEI